MAKKGIIPPVLREPVEVDQVVRELRDIHDMLASLQAQIFTEPLVVLDVNQSGSIGTFQLTISDINFVVIGIEFQAKTDPGGFPGSWSTNWTSSVGTIGDDPQLLRSVNVGLQEGHNTTVKARVRYTDQLDQAQEISKVHTFDFDNVAEITGFEVGIEGATANISVAGDEDTVSVWYKLCGQADISAVLAFVGRTGTFTFPLDDTAQCIEVAGKDSNGQFGEWVRIELHKVGIDKVVRFPPPLFIPATDATLFSYGQKWYLHPNHVGGITSIFQAPIVLPQGVTITNWAVRMYKENHPADLAQASISRVTSSGAVFLDQWTQTTTGWVTHSQSLSELVSSSNAYLIEVSLAAGAAGTVFDAELNYAEVGYSVPSFEEAL